MLYLQAAQELTFKRILPLLESVQETKPCIVFFPMYLRTQRDWEATHMGCVQIKMYDPSCSEFPIVI